MKITRIQRKELERRLLNGERQYLLAKEYGVSQAWVSRIAKKIGASYCTVHSHKALVARNIKSIEAGLETESCRAVARRLKVSPHYIYPIKKARQSEART